MFENNKKPALIEEAWPLIKKSREPSQCHTHIEASHSSGFVIIQGDKQYSPALPPPVPSFFFIIFQSYLT